MSDCDISVPFEDRRVSEFEILMTGGGFTDGWDIKLYNYKGERLSFSYDAQVVSKDRTHIDIQLEEPVGLNVHGKPNISYYISNDNWISDLNTDKDSETGFFSTNRCKHDTFTYRKVRVKLWLFELVMLYRVCHDCHELIKDYKKWKITLR